MAWKPNPIIENRVLLAIDLMTRNGWGIERASIYAKTTRRTVHRYAKHLGIKLKGKDGVALKVIRPPKTKVTDFLIQMHKGKSATAAAKSLKTTVRTMAKQEWNGTPIMTKVGNRWVLNLIPVTDKAIVYYGKLIGFKDAVQGRGVLAGPDANKPKNKNKKDEDYADIWWQLDFNAFASTLPLEQVAEFWQDEVMKRLKRRLEDLLHKDISLVAKFKTNSEVAADMASKGRTGNRISELEKQTKRYDLTLDDEVTHAVDDRFNINAGLTFIPKADFVKGNKATKRTAIGKFQMFYMTKNSFVVYPKNGPLRLPFGYDLADE